MKLLRLLRFAAPVTVLIATAANATPIVATPADNQNLRTAINVTGGAHLTSTIADILAPPGLQFITTNVSIAQGVLLKGIAPDIPVT